MAPGMYHPKFHSKSSGDGGGGGMTLGRSTTSQAVIHDAQMILSLNRDNEFYIMKNRHGDKGATNIEGALDIIANMLTHAVFDGSMDMFQETMKMKIVEALEPIVSGKNIIPEGDIDGTNPLQRESGSNGTRRNSLLQRFISLRR